MKSFFGDIIYEFPLCKAVYELNVVTNKTYLTPYYYYPIKISLNAEESERYFFLTRKIVNLIKKKGIDLSTASLEDLETANIEDLERLLFKRSEIIKTASEKIEKLPEILRKIQDRQGDLKDTILFTHEKIIDKVIRVVESTHATYRRFTQELSLKEREQILDAFKKGHIDVLIAIKILDEGVDIPSAKNAVIISSTTNPREYIQRLGRVLRPSENKPLAYIYDFVVLDSLKMFSNSPELHTLEEKFARSELLRVRVIAECSLNGINAVTDVFRW
ncbi:DEAD/DEAH box helicase [Fervidobacterium thailandense]|uniref:DEAD/DEAH box helicase n=1 Tax=Fervidobacterium thailandense TaxID=1008305 RepID=UPI001F4E20EA|nr:helicase-related protein [Fervidobacterium thailandense]